MPADPDVPRRYRRAFASLQGIASELRRIRAERREIAPQVERLLEAVGTLDSQLRGAINGREGEDELLEEGLELGWRKVRWRLDELADGHPLAATLSPREVQVLRGAASGLGNKQIAAQLGISPRTARNVLSSVYAKLSVSGRAEAAVMAVRLGLVDA